MKAGGGEREKLNLQLWKHHDRKFKGRKSLCLPGNARRPNVEYIRGGNGSVDTK